MRHRGETARTATGGSRAIRVGRPPWKTIAFRNSAPSARPAAPGVVSVAISTPKLPTGEGSLGTTPRARDDGLPPPSVSITPEIMRAAGPASTTGAHAPPTTVTGAIFARAGGPRPFVGSAVRTRWACPSLASSVVPKGEGDATVRGSEEGHF